MKVNTPYTFSTIGQDSHKFEPQESQKPLMLGGIKISGCVGLMGNSDADVVLHAITNAISGATGVNILGKIADDLCKSGITDSRAYLTKALEFLGEKKIVHVSITLEGKRPKMFEHISMVRSSIASLLGINEDSVGFTATTGEELTSCGRGEGLSVFAILTLMN